MSDAPLRLGELLDRLVDGGVRFVLVGDLAVNAWGYLRATRDVDLVPDPDPENLNRLGAALLELGARVETADGTLGGDALRTFLRAGDRTLVLTELGHVDVLQGSPQVPDFATLAADAVEVEIGGRSVRVCSLERLLDMKRASDRPRDRDDLEALEAGHDREDA
jgi:predicted nucleotidyltransferase